MSHGPARIQIVELLRGLAAVSVAWFHLTSAHRDTWVAASGAYGWLGVEIFFVISGFIVPYSMHLIFDTYRLHHAPVFLVRRVIRLEPAYIASLVLVLTLYYLSSLAPGFQGVKQHYSVEQFLFHFFYLIPFTDYQWLQPVYWTLAYEFAFYVFMSLTFGVFCSDRNRPVALATLTLLCALVLTGFLPARVLLFTMGFAVFRKQAGLSRSAEAITLTLLALSTMMVVGARLEGLVGAATALVILFGSRLALRPPIAHWIGAFGAISYSLYLVHIPIGGRVVNLGRRFIDTPTEALVLSLAALLASCAAAWLLWRMIEVPSIAAARRWGSTTTLARQQGTA